MVYEPERAPELEAQYGASEIRDVAGYATYCYCRLFVGDLESVIGAPTTSNSPPRSTPSSFPMP